jgi:hypothetical protein
MSKRRISNRATSGEKSMKPVRGRTRRIGAMIGSVIWSRIWEIGQRAPGSNQERIARAMMANCMTERNVRSTFRTSVTVWNPPILSTCSSVLPSEASVKSSRFA